MPELSTRSKPGPGRPGRHGGYAFMTKGALPENRSYIRAYLTEARQQLIEDCGGKDNVSAAQEILVDRAISKLGIARLIEEFCRENGCLSGVELQPSLRHYLSYTNSLRRDLCALRDLAKVELETAPRLQDVIREFDEARAKGGNGE